MEKPSAVFYMLVKKLKGLHDSLEDSSSWLLWILIEKGEHAYIKLSKEMAVSWTPAW